MYVCVTDKINTGECKQNEGYHAIGCKYITTKIM